MVHWETEGTAEAAVIKIFNPLSQFSRLGIQVSCVYVLFILSGCDVLGLGFLSSLPSTTNLASVLCTHFHVHCTVNLSLQI